MRRDVYSAVLLRRGETEKVVVLVYRSADGAEAVVAVCKDIGYREALKPACPCRLDYPDVGYVVRCQSIKADPEPAVVSRRIVGGGIE